MPIKIIHRKWVKIKIFIYLKFIDFTYYINPIKNVYTYRKYRLI